MLNTPEMRHLQAVIVLAEELNFTRAAQILRIGQPALSKQITEVEGPAPPAALHAEKGTDHGTYRSR